MYTLVETNGCAHTSGHRELNVLEWWIELLASRNAGATGILLNFQEVDQELQSGYMNIFLIRYVLKP